MQVVKRQLGSAPEKAVGEESSCGNTAGVFDSHCALLDGAALKSCPTVVQLSGLEPDAGTVP